MPPFRAYFRDARETGGEPRSGTPHLARQEPAAWAAAIRAGQICYETLTSEIAKYRVAASCAKIAKSKITKR